LEQINQIIGYVSLLSLPSIPIISSLPVLNPYWIVCFAMGKGSFTFAESI